MQYFEPILKQISAISQIKPQEPMSLRCIAPSTYGILSHFLAYASGNKTAKMTSANRAADLIPHV